MLISALHATEIIVCILHRLIFSLHLTYFTFALVDENLDVGSPLILRGHGQHKGIQRVQTSNHTSASTRVFHCAFARSIPISTKFARPCQALSVPLGAPMKIDGVRFSRAAWAAWAPCHDCELLLLVTLYCFLNCWTINLLLRIQCYQCGVHLLDVVVLDAPCSPRGTTSGRPECCPATKGQVTWHLQSSFFTSSSMSEVN